jgi:hypothetical protein
MKAARFLGWAISKGGLGHDSANSYLSCLTAVESDYAVNLDAEPLDDVVSRLSADRGLNADAKKNRLTAVKKYARFLSATAA